MPPLLLYRQRSLGMLSIKVYTEVYLMLEQFQVMLVGSSRGGSEGMLLLSKQLGGLGRLQLLPQHPPHCTLLLQTLLQTQHPCNATQPFITLQVALTVHKTEAKPVQAGARSWEC